MQNTSLKFFVVTVAALGLTALPVRAHHSFAAEFDVTKRVSLTGVVTRVDWGNPHVWFFVDVKDEATGSVTNWGAEMGGTNALVRNGWTRNTLKVGTLVSFNGSLAKDGSYRVNASRILVDGKPLRPASSEGAGR